MKKNLWGFLIIFVIVTGIAFGMAFADYSYEMKSGENSLGSGSLNFTYEEPDNALVITEATGIADSVGKISDDYFALAVGSDTPNIGDIDYYVTIQPDETSTLEEEAVKIFLTSVNNPDDPIVKEVAVIDPELVSNLKTYDLAPTEHTNLIVYNTTFKSSTENTANRHYYRLRVWIDEEFVPDVTATGPDFVVEEKQFKFRVNICV